MGEKWSEKNRVQEILGLCFFPDHLSPMSGTLFFFQSTKTVSALDTPSCKFLEPGFWILTKGGQRHPVLVLPYPSSIQVLGMEHWSNLVKHLIGKGRLKTASQDIESIIIYFLIYFPFQPVNSSSFPSSSNSPSFLALTRRKGHINIFFLPCF